MVEIDKTNIFEDEREWACQSVELGIESKIAHLLGFRDRPKIQIFSSQNVPITQLSLPYKQVNTILYHSDNIYFAGPDIFAKIKNESEIEEILTRENPKLPGSEIGLFYIFFQGNIYHLFESQEYPNFIQFQSNISPAITVFYNPKDNEFYISPCRMRKGYKLTLNNKVEEIIPYLAEEEKEDFENWMKEFGVTLNE